MQKNEKTEHIKIKTGLCACVNTPYGLSKKEVVILGGIGIHTYTGTHHTHTHIQTLLQLHAIQSFLLTKAETERVVAISHSYKHMARTLNPQCANTNANNVFCIVHSKVVYSIRSIIRSFAVVVVHRIKLSV